MGGKDWIELNDGCCLIFMIGEHNGRAKMDGYSNDKPAKRSKTNEEDIVSIPIFLPTVLRL